jgi:hypothetical protein
VRAAATSFTLSKHTGGGGATPAFSDLRVCLQFTWEVGLPPSPMEFSSHCHFYKLSRSWLLGKCRPLLPSQDGLFISSSMRDCPSLSLWRSGHSSLFTTCLFCYCLLLSFSFFPGWGSVCPGGYADLAQGCLWEYHLSLSSPCGLRLPKQSGCWCLVAARGPSWFVCLT